MNSSRAHFLILCFNLLYFIPFTFYYFASGNLEFLWYSAVLAAAGILVWMTLPRTGFGPVILGGLSLWGLMHMAGGSVPAGKGVLYNVILLPLVNQGELQVVRFDQVVHFFGFGTCTLIGNHLLKPHLKDPLHDRVPGFFLVMIGMGFGALNEIVEFAAVLAVPKTGVGGYENTALDLVANALGALAAVFLVRLKPALR